MKRLLSIELQKLFTHNTSKTLIFLSFILPLLVILLAAIKIDFFGFFTIELGSSGIFNFPMIWHVTTYFAALFKIFFAIVAVWMISSEYNNKTLKQNLIDGLSKKELILSKFYVIVFFSFLSTVVICIITLILGFTYSSYDEISIILSDIEYLAAYFVKLLGFYSCCIFLGVLVKRSAFALAFLFIDWIFENIIFLVIYWQFNAEKAAEIQGFLPLNACANLIKQPMQRIAMTKFPNTKQIAYDYSVHTQEIIIVLIWTLIFISFSYLILKKRDL